MTERSLDAAAAADVAQAEALVAQDELQAARIAAAQPTAELVRQRFEATGRLVTSKQTPFTEIVDENALDMVALWPFVSTEAKAKALRAWAKTTGHKKQMTGASIGFRDDAVIR
jgi:multidrug efflux pump subunit AcrA (membrane-fusion protein)